MSAAGTLRRLFSGLHGQCTPPWAIEIQSVQRVIIKLLEAILASLDDVLKDVTDQATRLDSLSTLIVGLKQQLAAALAGTTLSPDTQAKVDAIFAAAETNKGKIDAALNTNVPPPAAAPAAAPSAAPAS